MDDPNPNIETVLTAAQFIEDNLCEELTVADIADAVNYSVFHFCRLFNKTARISPWDYVIRRRLTEAAEYLVSFNSAKIIEVALDHQFNNHETFTRAFKRMFGATPKEVRCTSRFDRRREMPPLFEPYIRHLVNGGVRVSDTLKKHDSYTLAGLSDNGDFVDLEPLLMWRTVGQIGEIHEWGQIPQRYCAVRYFHEDCNPLLNIYITGLLLAEKPNHALPCPTMDIPALYYYEFIHTGSLPAILHTLTYIYSTWLARPGHSNYPLFHLEMYGDSPPKDMKSSIKIIILVPVEPDSD